MEAPKARAKSHDWLKWKPEESYNDDHLSVDQEKENLKHCNMDLIEHQNNVQLQHPSVCKNSFACPKTDLGKQKQIYQAVNDFYNKKPIFQFQMKLRKLPSFQSWRPDDVRVTLVHKYWHATSYLVLKHAGTFLQFSPVLIMF